MTNLEAARRVIGLALELGATDFCVCGGSRNAPLVAVLAVDGWQLADASTANRQPPTVNSFVDERSAAFFALGRAKLTGKPAAVVTTSGTAAAELLPAAIEAHYSGIPLILITADRPARYRGTGAPQAIEQEGIFGVYAARDAATWSGAGALHINVEFDEPLIDEVAGSRGLGVSEQPFEPPAAQPRNPATARPGVSGSRGLGVSEQPFEPSAAQPRNPATAQPGVSESRGLEVSERSFEPPAAQPRNPATAQPEVSESRGLEVSEQPFEPPAAQPRNRATPQPGVSESRSQQSTPRPRNRATPQPQHDRPIVLLSGLAPQDRERVKDFVLRLGAPVYAEPLSGLREDPAVAHLAITAGERMIARARPTRVIRIGNVPTLRFWRDLDESRRELPLVSYSRLPFAGLSRGEVKPLDELPDPSPSPWLPTDNGQLSTAIESILDTEPQSELAMVRELSRTIPHGARVYLGNSLPIREWDLAATRQPRGFTYEANRGANGIDGQLSTFLGQCEPGRANVGVVGDLTAIYDANAPWIVPQLGGVDFRIVIIHNNGGRIFDRVASLSRIDKSLIINAHDFDFESWARSWRIEDRVTVLRPDAEASARAWARYDALWS